MLKLLLFKITWDSVDAGTAQMFIYMLQREGVGDGTIKLRMTHIQEFYRWALNKGYIQRLPYEIKRLSLKGVQQTIPTIKLPNKPNIKVKAQSMEDFERVLASNPRKSSALNKRDEIIAEIARYINLQFGAEIKELIVEPQSQHFKSNDGNVYSYEKYKANPTISKLMAKGFQYTQSPNSNLKARKKTNSAINISINKFLKWIEEINYTGQLDRNLLLNYKKFLIDNHVSWSVYSYYTVIARICSVLVEKGLITSFVVPKNISLQQARNSSINNIYT